jgi:leucyl-tRNA synthetase
MILLNTLESETAVSKESAKSLVMMLAPFAPHLSEELWEKLGGEGSVHQQSWPAYDESLITESEVEIVVQVGGRRRG